MATSVTTSPFLPDIDPASTADRWAKWVTSLEFYFDAAEVTTDARKKALLLHHMGGATQDIFISIIRPSLANQEPRIAETYASIKSALSSHFAPNVNVDFEIFQFRQARQLQDESMEEYVGRLRGLAINCKFPNAEKEIKQHIIYSCADPGLRRRALRDSTLDLPKLLVLARTHEATEQQAKQIEDDLGKLSLARQLQPTTHAVLNIAQQAACPNCGTSHTPSWESCPAQGRACTHCGKLNHFSIVCRSRLAGRPPISSHETHTQNYRVTAASLASPTVDHHINVTTGSLMSDTTNPVNHRVITMVIIRDDRAGCPMASNEVPGDLQSHVIIMTVTIRNIATLIDRIVI